MSLTAFHIALMLACSIAGPFPIPLPLPFEDPEPQIPPEPCVEVIDPTSKLGIDCAFTRIDQRVNEFVTSYAYSRMRSVNLVLRNPVAFGLWEAAWDPTITKAMDDGSLTEWEHRYYVTHNWSSYGQAILSMQPGDEVVVNGITVHIKGLFDYPKSSYYNEVAALIDDALPSMRDAAAFQTCVPDSDYNRIVYGTVEHHLIVQGS